MRGCLRRIIAWSRREDAYTFSLNMALLSVTVGMMLLLVLAWLASALTAGIELKRVASASALAAAAQVTQSVSGSGSGFLSSASWMMSSSYASAANERFTEQMQDTHLDKVFDNLACHENVNGTQVTVTASGTFLPLFLQEVATRVPGISAMRVPMEVRASAQYSVVGKGGD
ncbi:hypothetical protein [Alicyclobacillus fodiniaquatilis]|uniref:Flp pilus-assembly TadG-like N-terminal domain-containing protein n=1 Tax=Alicyclobacillus fodiniaquatilis TaxID=1661150 RepID=A0ABW4JGH8_9BACL